MDLASLYHQALAAQHQGDFAAAEQGYRRILEAAPGQVETRHSLGALRAQQGRLEEALELIGGVVADTPTPARLLDYGVVLREAHRPAEALAAFDRGLGLEPGHLSLLKLRCDMLLLLGRFDEALAAYDHILSLRPATPVLLHGRGNALKGLGRHDEAVEAFSHALSLSPEFFHAFYDRAKSLAARHRLDEWFAGYQQLAKQIGGRPAWSAHGEGPPPPHKDRHDREQHEWQHANGITPDPAPPHIEAPGRLSGPAINSACAPKAAQAWRDGNPKIAVVDNFLTPEALAALRRFALGSTIWRSAYREGYLGAFPDHGFATPLLAQVVEEFRTVFSEICGGHALNYLWGFKYDSSLSGIGIHADNAAVNVNFWITPDEANLDPDSGGLVIWDVAAPLDWDAPRYNSDEGAIRAFLEKSGARPVTVPYRANRAVIFDSDLFHQTDKIAFREGFENRRINITLLYGERDPGKAG